MAGDFVDLIAWQQAVELARLTAPLAQRLRGPGASDMASQMRRAAESVPANIAEGYGRGLGRDFARFLNVAGGSGAELESHIRVAMATGRVSDADALPVLALCRRVRALIRGLARAVVDRPRPQRSPSTPLT